MGVTTTFVLRHCGTWLSLITPQKNSLVAMPTHSASVVYAHPNASNVNH